MGAPTASSQNSTYLSQSQLHRLSFIYTRSSIVNMGSSGLPSKMKALRYEKPEVFSVVEAPLPQLREHDVLVKVKASGVCGTDLHIHEGEFLAKFPLIPGHETVGVVAALGPKVKGFKVGDRVVADNSELCGECFYCRRGEELLCEDFQAHGSPWTVASLSTAHTQPRESSRSRTSATSMPLFSSRLPALPTVWTRSLPRWVPVCSCSVRDLR